MKLKAKLGLGGSPFTFLVRAEHDTALYVEPGFPRAGQQYIIYQVHGVFLIFSQFQYPVQVWMKELDVKLVSMLSIRSCCHLLKVQEDVQSKLDFRFHKLLDLQESGFNAQNQTSLELQPGRKAHDSQILGQRWSKRHLHLPSFELKWLGWQKD